MTELVTLISTDGQEFCVDVEDAKKFATVKNLIDDIGTNENIPINASGKSLSIMFECLKYQDTEGIKSKCSSMDQSTLFEVVLTANYLAAQEILDAACHTIADMIRGKSPASIRKTFNITSDFTPEEEEQVKKENEWITEK